MIKPRNINKDTAAMPLNLKALNRPIDPVTRDYDWKDVVLYALGVGAGLDELEYCYEKDLKVLPTFAMPAIMDFFWQVGIAAGVNPAGVLHGEQELILHAPLPVSGCFETRGQITDYWDKGPEKGALVVARSDTFSADNTRLFTSILTVFSRLDGGFGGENRTTTPPPMPQTGPDEAVAAHPAAIQPLLYRLSGDLFPLHVDPDFARLAGFSQPIMHGLCTMGYACRALINTFVPKAPEKVQRIGCRFTRPLYPDIPIETRIWETGPGKARWQCINLVNGETVIDFGRFEYTAN